MTTHARDRRRSQRRNRPPTVPKKEVWIPVPEQFVDVEGETWDIQRSNSIERDVGLPGALIFTLRKMPVPTAGDSERALTIIRILVGVRDSDAAFIRMDEADFDWMLTAMKEHGHKGIWYGADAAYLRQWVEDNHLTEDPSQEKTPTPGENGNR